MAAFLDPFPGLTPGRKLTDREVTRAIRLALAGEQEAIHLYEALADATENTLAKAVLQDIANEERVHAGEFLHVLSLLLADEDDRLKQGRGEVEDLRKRLGATDGTDGPRGSAAPSVGNLKGN
jgi:rubrerythrin